MMRYVTIPNTDLSVSGLCIGSTDIGSTIPADDAFRLLDAFVEEGGNFVDTAHVYANWRDVPTSISEKTIGAWMKQRGNRHTIVLATKGAHPELDTMTVPRMSREDILRDLNESLEYLQTDVIDLYWLHRDDIGRPAAEIVDTLNEQVNAGKIRYFGCSNWRVSRIREANEYAAERGIQGFVANQLMWSYAVPNMDKIPDQTLAAMDAEGIVFHTRTGMAAIPYSSQARGFFTKLANGGYKNLKGPMRRDYYNPTNVKRLERARVIAERYGATLNEVGLAYLMGQPFPVVPIVGCKNVEHLAASLKALEVVLTPEDVAYLEGDEMQ